MPRAATARASSSERMANPSGQTISSSLRVARAMSLARQGRIKDAEAAIGEDNVKDPLSLEVLAVIVTSEGDYPRGLRLWSELLQNAPQHAEAKRMVGAIELWLSRPSWVRYVPATGATLLIVLLGAIFWALTREPVRASPPRRAVPAAVSPVIAPSSTASPATPSSPRLSSPRPDPGSPSGVPAVNYSPPKSQPRR
jgi:hypothetical protein